MKKEANLLYEISTMRKIVRNHRPSLLLDDLTDNISTHSYLTTWAAYIIAKCEKADAEKVLLMAMSHDIAETRTGDMNWINKNYVKVFEDEAIEDILPKGLDYLNIKTVQKEYDKRESIEAKCVKDADRIAQIIILEEQIVTFGNQRAKRWQTDIDGWIESTFLTKSGKKLAFAVYKTDVYEWSKGLYVDKRR